MNRSWFALGACLLVVTGCVHSTKARFVQHYTLDAPAPREAQVPADARILQIARIGVPEWLEGTAMYYRLDYRVGGRMATYADSDWIAPLATLLEPLLEKALVAGGGWRAVIGPGSLAGADVSLQIRLDDFAQVFSQPQQSSGVLDATATLISNHDERVIAQRHFHVEVSAPTPDAQGGVRAMNEASAQFAGQLQRWSQRARDENGTKGSSDPGE